MLCTGPSDVLKFAMSEKSVETWMHRGVISCSPETPVEEVAKTMEAEDVSALVVVNDEGEAIGVISRTDLVNARFVQPYMKHWRGMSASHLMSQPVVNVSPDASIRQAARLMHERNVHRVVVGVRERGKLKPVGILSVTDLAKHAHESTETA
jgi:CBS domain-containing protein